MITEIRDSLLACASDEKTRDKLRAWAKEHLVGLHNSVVISEVELSRAQKPFQMVDHVLRQAHLELGEFLQKNGLTVVEKKVYTEHGAPISTMFLMGAYIIRPKPFGKGGTVWV